MESSKPNGRIMKIICRYLLPAAFLGVYIVFAVLFSHHTPIYNPYGSGAGGEVDYERAVVDSVDTQAYSPSEFPGLYTGNQQVTVKLETGRYAGKTFQIKNALNYDTNYVLHKGERVVVSVNTSTDKNQVVNIYMYTPWRMLPLIILIALFAAALCIIGGRKGFRSIVGIAFTLTTVFFIFIPMLIRGAPTVMATLLAAAATSCVTLFLVGGFDRKSLSAVLGTIAGVFISIVVLLIFGNILQVSGYTDPNADALLNIAGNCRLQVQGLFFAGIIISSLGAVMDIAISVATTVNEIHIQNPAAGIKELFRSGLNVGRDMMGTMVNTLLLAYAGASVVSFIEMYSYQVQTRQLFNSNQIAMQILEAVCGSLAVILTVPIVSLISARFCKDEITANPMKE